MNCREKEENNKVTMLAVRLKACLQFRFPVWMAPTQDSSFVVCCSPQLPADRRLFFGKNGTGYLVLISSAASVKP